MTDFMQNFNFAAGAFREQRTFAGVRAKRAKRANKSKKRVNVCREFF